MAALAGAALFMSGAMALVWWIAERTRRSGFIDTCWSLATGMAAAGLVLSLIWTGAGTARPFVVAALIGLWSARLGGHILTRTLGGGDDPRYAALRAEWGPRASIRMFLFLQSQAVAGWILAVSAWLAAGSRGPELDLIDGLGLAIALFALWNERSADRALAAFRKKGRSGAICEDGWWARSRHPNYFFEFLFWVGIAVFGIDLSLDDLSGICAWMAPAMMYYLLVHVSGIPPLEAHMEASRGEAFRDYQRRVPVFFPKLF